MGSTLTSRRRLLFCLVPAASGVLALGLSSPASAVAAVRAAGHQPAATKATPVTIALSDADSVDLSYITSGLTNDRKADCAGKPVSGSRSLAQALADARKIEAKAGGAAVRAVNDGRDKNPGDAELDASDAVIHGNPVGALAALLAAYNKNAKDTTIVRDIGSVLAQLDEPEDAIALFNQADRLKEQIPSPVGISESATELNDRGFALLELRQWAAAGSDFTRAAAQAPLLSEAKLNLGVALMCQDKIPQAAKALVAGARRNEYTRLDEISGSIEVVPANQIIDISYGKAGSWPDFVYPETLGDSLRDDKSFSQFYTDETNTFFAESDQADKLFTLGYGAITSTVSQDRVANLSLLADDSVAGGWAADEARASAAQVKASDWFGTVFTGSPGGTAYEEAAKLFATGKPICTLKPTMDDWLTQQTVIFHSDVVAWADDLEAEWQAQSKWVSGVLANIKNSDLNKAWSLYYDAEKNLDLSSLTQLVGFWDQGNQQYGGDFSGTNCEITEGPGETAPPDPRLPFQDCPAGLNRASFNISLEILDISVNCEKITISPQVPALGPFAKVTWSRNGDLTLLIGVKGGVSLGPASAGVSAGVYITAHDGDVTDAGVTASAGASVKAGPLNLSAGSVSGSVSFTDLSSDLVSLVQ